MYSMARIVPIDTSPAQRKETIATVLGEEIQKLGMTPNATLGVIDGIEVHLIVSHQRKYYRRRNADGTWSYPENTKFKITWGGHFAFHEIRREQYVLTELEPKRGFNLEMVAKKVVAWVQKQKEIKRLKELKRQEEDRLEGIADRLNELVPERHKKKIEFRVDDWNRPAEICVDICGINSEEKLQMLLNRILHIMELEEVDYSTHEPVQTESV